MLVIPRDEIKLQLTFRPSCNPSPVLWIIVTSRILAFEEDNLPEGDHKLAV